ncbi:DUF4422 domain-containing protein, partial [Escherichia coli]|nr:DUF4422 domain-containing protein [Escherichia coli]
MANIYIATHKNYPFPPGYIPLHVGKRLSSVYVPNAIGDDSKNNISDLNPFFCELTGLYWIWQNDADDVIGLVHYRRYFKHKNDYITIKNKKIASCNDLIKEFDSYDLILPKPSYLFKKTLKEQYIKYHHEDDLIKLRQIIEKKYPDYISTFDTVLNGNKGYYCNMFIAKKNIIEPYFQWVFDILFELKSSLDISGYDDYQKRVFGFLSERLFAVWIEYNKNRIQITHRSVVEIESNKVISVKRYIRNFLAKL